MIHPRVRSACLFFALLLIGACETDSQSDAMGATSIRAAAEAPAAPVSQIADLEPTPPGYDRFGRLRRAKELVHGFEVPVGLKLVERTERWLEFELRRPYGEIYEFYAGVDEASKRAFKKTGYLVDRGKGGFDVRHTAVSRHRLGIDERFDGAFVFVTPKKNRTQTLRVYAAPRAMAPRDNPFIPRINFEGETTGTVVLGPESASADWVPPSIEPSSSGRRGPTVVEPAGTAPAGVRRWGPYLPTEKRSVRSKLRKWKRAHPGELFLD